MFIFALLFSMQVIRHIKELQAVLNEHRLQGDDIGLVPTMGALHDGHLSLIKTSVRQNKVTVVSIYVNPTQFNDENDLRKYPRNIEQDCILVESTGSKIVFAPSDEEMYPEPDRREFDFGLLDLVMEGKHRPGHFNGVAKIITKLFDAVKPNRAYFGQKDFQQLAIIRKLVRDQKINIDIIACPIVRENDALAMSSRNTLLNPKQRAAAPLIYQTLIAAKKLFIDRNIEEIKKFVQISIQSSPLLKLEYFEVVDSATLQSVEIIKPGKSVTACIAVLAGNIRLIDNIEYIS
jgi:pantoate--beta-alanine ligase